LFDLVVAHTSKLSNIESRRQLGWPRWRLMKLLPRFMEGIGDEPLYKF
jgi:hypothetical protein